MKYLESIETEKCSLEVYECECGFHIGFDISYLNQVGPIKTKCPSCKIEIKVEEIE